MSRKVRIDYFLAGLVAMVLLALVLPAPGISGGMLHFDLVTTYGISVVFFFYGLTLAPDRMKAGLLLWRVHVVVQVATYLVFPAIVIIVRALLPHLLSGPLWLGFFYVAALPSTVSSSVAMTSLARGNVPAAVFNASLSSFLGVFITPVWMSWYLSSTGVALPLGPVILKVVLLVLVPIVAGQLARRWLVGWAQRYAGLIKMADRVVILAIVYNSFCDSVAGGVWSGNDIWTVGTIAVGAVALFAVVYLITDLVCTLFGFSVPERIAAQFCGSKKSLATGAPLAKVIFGATPTLGLLIAPIMMYHFLQLVMVTFLANRFAVRTHD